MKKRSGWFGLPFGQTLRKLHSWNYWLVLLLAVTGILLFLPVFRAALPQERVWVKQVHILLGVVSAAVVLVYLPMLGRHLRQLAYNRGQRWNLWSVLFLLLGWIVSGVILWQFRHLPPTWSNAALIAHDAFTWIGVPYAVYHSLTRLRWVKRQQFVPLVMREPSGGESLEASPDGHAAEVGKPAAAGVQAADAGKTPAMASSVLSRRNFIRWAVGLALAFAVGPSFIRWIKRTLDDGGSSLQEIASSSSGGGSAGAGGAEGAAGGAAKAGADTAAVDGLKPLPGSNPPLGGGAKGNFRIYSVAYKMPQFSAETWKFTVGGLVAKPLVYTWEEFLQIPRKVQVSDFHCVTGWSVNNCTWEGIPLSYFLDLAGVKASAKYVNLFSGDNVYNDSLTLEQSRMDDVMVVCLLDGKPIPQ